MSSCSSTWTLPSWAASSPLSIVKTSDPSLRSASKLSDPGRGSAAWSCSCSSPNINHTARHPPYIYPNASDPQVLLTRPTYSSSSFALSPAY
ncbi:hypothetical protein CRG98_040094 [Punica granatum]|uniref:Uncharacterized protein n=1 Tax=Punica granatum TaxID=22663 RepID=A0A2I0I6J3_PUNGR|nr:hypothetical protein CRG98_040094 [Punica granatum]